MTLRQLILKFIYPALMQAGNIFGVRAGISKNKACVEPPTSFYTLSASSLSGQEIRFEEFRGRNVLLVNTASDCGYTNQLSDLNKLHKLYREHLVIIGFPSNDFKEQEKLSNEEIAAFCTKNFGVDFLFCGKSVVVKNPQQNPVFEWLSLKRNNGWNDKAPEWNFSKYLVDRTGVLRAYFGPGVAPLSSAINKELEI